MDPQPVSKKRNATTFRVKPKNRETRFIKLRSLKCFPEMHDRILQGWPLSEVAKFVQEVRKEYADVTRDGLVAVLKEYRATIPPAQLIQKRMLPVFQKAADEVRKGVNELEEMEKLYELQMKRIQIDMATEEKIHKLLPTMTQEMRVAREILGSIADLKMDLGLSQRHLGSLELNAQVATDLAGRYGSDAVAQVVQNPESRRKVLGMAERLLQLAQRKREAGEPDEELGPDQEIGLEDVEPSAPEPVEGTGT